MKILFISYFFPPLGLSGVQRVVKFVKYLPLHGWECSVITVGKTLHLIKDESLVSDIPQNTSIHRIDDIILKELTLNLKETCLHYHEPLRAIMFGDILYKEIQKSLEEKMNAIRAITLQPDFAILWCNKVVQFINDKNDWIKNFDIIFTSGPPHTTHLIGYYVKKNFNIPWFMDMRDEWSSNPYHQELRKQTKSVDSSQEEECLRNADRVICIGEAQKQSLTRQWPFIKCKSQIISNGYDEEDFKNIQYSNNKNAQFTITHLGHLYGPRTPDPIMKALENLIKDGKIDISKTHIQLIGHAQDELKTSIIRLYPNIPIHWTPNIAHNKCLMEASKADLLLLIVGKTNACKRIYTGKIFEYLRLQKPILALSPHGSVVEAILKETQSGFNFSYNEIQKIESFIFNQYQSWMKQKGPTYINTKHYECYERNYLTKKLSNALLSALIHEPCKQ